MKIETIPWRARFKASGGDVDPSSMVFIPGTKYVRFSSHPSPFVMCQRICGNAGCGCREIVVGFIETEEDGRSKKRGLVFDVPVDVDRFERGRNERLPSEARPLADEFVSAISAEMKAVLRRQFEDYRAMLRSEAEYRISAEEVANGERIAAASVFGWRAPGGQKHFPFWIEHESGSIGALDFYCVNPACDCQEVLLRVARFDEPLVEGQGAGGLFSMRVSFDYRFVVEETFSWDEEQAAALAQGWLKGAWAEMGVMEWRYGRIKGVGERILNGSRLKHEVSPALSGALGQWVGPNQSCPCGSGRKYKKCCGRFG